MFCSLWRGEEVGEDAEDGEDVEVEAEAEAEAEVVRFLASDDILFLCLSLRFNLPSRAWLVAKHGYTEWYVELGHYSTACTPLVDCPSYPENVEL